RSARRPAASCGGPPFRGREQRLELRRRTPVLAADMARQGEAVALACQRGRLGRERRAQADARRMARQPLAGGERAGLSPRPGEEARPAAAAAFDVVARLREFDLGLRSEEHTSELQSRENLVCRLLLEQKKNTAPNDS